MEIETKIKDVISAKLGEGLIEKLIAENLEKGINHSIERLLGEYGDITQVIEGKIKEVMLKQLSSYDYTKYVVNLDYVLTEILQRTTLDHKKILENFKELMLERNFPQIIKLSVVFEEFKEFVAESVDIDELEINGLNYENVSVTMKVEHEEERGWSNCINAKIVLECKKDEKLNCEIHISKYREYPWEFVSKSDLSINSLRYLDRFKLYILKLYQCGAKIEIDEEYLEDRVIPNEQPERGLFWVCNGRFNPIREEN